FELEAATQTASHATASHAANHLVCRNQGVEKHTEKWIEQEHRHYSWRSELDYATVIADPACNKRLKSTAGTQAYFGIYRERPQMRIRPRYASLRQNASVHAKSVVAVIESGGEVLGDIHPTSKSDMPAIIQPVTQVANQRGKSRTETRGQAMLVLRLTVTS